LALGVGGCASSSEETGVGTQTTPAAAAGEPATVEPGPAAAAPAATPAPAEAPAPVPAEQPATPAANAQPAQQQPTLGVIVTHKVKDFDAWKTAFDSHQAARKEAGFVGHGLMRDASNDKIVSVWLPATDEAKAQAFVDSKDLKDKMKEAGVQGKPEVTMMKTIAAKMDPAKQGLSAAMVKASVKDFEAFKTAFTGTEATRADGAGVVGWGLGQDLKDANTAYLYLQSDDVAKLKAYVESKDTKKAWKDAGVKGTAKTTYAKEGEMTMYQ
jgi:quinol monooxygenase YgiN